MDKKNQTDTANRIREIAAVLRLYLPDGDEMASIPGCNLLDYVLELTRLADRLDPNDDQVAAPDGTPKEACADIMRRMSGLAGYLDTFTPGKDGWGSRLRCLVEELRSTVLPVPDDVWVMTRENEQLRDELQDAENPVQCGVSFRAGYRTGWSACREGDPNDPWQHDDLPCPQVDKSIQECHDALEGLLDRAGKTRSKLHGSKPPQERREIPDVTPEVMEQLKREVDEIFQQRHQQQVLPTEPLTSCPAAKQAGHAASIQKARNHLNEYRVNKDRDHLIDCISHFLDWAKHHSTK